MELLGTNAETIRKAEDRQLFKDTMLSIGSPSPKASIVENLDDCIKAAKTIDYPVIVRPAYTLGGSGGGIAENEAGA